MTSRTARGYLLAKGTPCRDRWGRRSAARALPGSVGSSPRARLAGIGHAECVLEALTGVGLATSAGLNAYIPLLAVGVFDRYTGLIDLPPSWQWLADGWVIAILALLLSIEVVADKVPVVDHVNDVIQTVVRPTGVGWRSGQRPGPGRSRSKTRVRSSAASNGY